MEQRSDDTATLARAIEVPLEPLPDGLTAPEHSITSLPVDHAGTTVHLSAWRLAGANPLPPVLFVHDLGEQSQLYAGAARQLARRGHASYAFDLRGHGRSGSSLGHAPSFQVLVKDLLQVAAWVRHAEGGRPPVIIGHGVGALILADFVLHYGAFCRAAVLSSPCFELAAPISAAGRFALRFLAEAAPMTRLPAFLCPRFAAAPRAQDVDDDEVLPFPRLTAVLAHELMLALDRVGTSFLACETPSLVLCPDQDDVCSFVQLRRTAALHAGTHLRFAELPGVGHGVFTEDRCREAALALMLPWLTETLAVPAAAGDT